VLVGLPFLLFRKLVGRGSGVILKGFTDFSLGWQHESAKPNSLFVFYQAFTEEMGTSHRLSWSIAQARQEYQKQSY